MDLETYEQPQLRKDIFGDDLLYMKENMQLVLSKYEEEIIDYILPNTVDHEVTDAEMAIAGDTAGSAAKQVTTETGLTVSVPLFIKIGDVIRVKTEDTSYVTRV
jgi:elongation factor P